MENQTILPIYGIAEELENIQSSKPFQIIFYGSRERGDYSEISDYNFYLIASSVDQLRSEFIQSINKSLNLLESISTVSLISTDPESFRTRIKLFEPCAIHIAETGRVFFGSGEFGAIHKDWIFQKANCSIDFGKLLSFMKNRLAFFLRLTSKNPKEEITRLERVIAYHIQIWCMEKIPDISVEELITLDIPSRIKPLIENLYAKEMDEDIENLLALYTQIYGLKRIVRFSMQDSGMNIKGLNKLSIALKELKAVPRFQDKIHRQN
ncbi:MAG: hypothetical protein L6Q54_07175 [Leptospiraceae bacterium]|nr:hypothetical protein [Leptospiraceae bacterium]